MNVSNHNFHCLSWKLLCALLLLEHAWKTLKKSILPIYTDYVIREIKKVWRNLLQYLGCHREHLL